MPVVDLSNGITDATFCGWRKKYGGVGPSELLRWRQLEARNSKLKQIVADLSPDKAVLQAVVAKKSEAFASAQVGIGVDAALQLQPAQLALHRWDVVSDLSIRIEATGRGGTEA